MTGRTTQARMWAVLIAATAIAVVASAQRQPPNVLLITIDTVRADHVGAYGYAKAATPAIDRLAREGVRFADATSQAPLTGPAHAAILTGQYPARFGVRDNASTPIPPGATTLATLFKANRYRTAGFVGAFILGPEYGFSQGFDDNHATFPGFTAGMKLQAQRRAGEVTAAALKWLNQQSAIGNQQSAKSNAPWFLWVHYYDAHWPYDPPAPFRTAFQASPYDGEVAYVDSNIAKLIAAIEAAGQLDRTVITVIADHGEGLGDHGEQEHGLFLYDSVLHVPWVMRLPARSSAGKVVTTQVRAIDVLPTLTTLAGTAVPSVDGQNVMPFVTGAAPRDPAPSYAETFYPKWHFGWSELKSVRVGDWKYIDAPKPELYDLHSDRSETKNAIDARGPLATGLSSEMAKLQSGFGAAAITDAPQPDPDTLARLRSLGYVGIAAPGGTGRGPDPKDMVPKIEMFKSGISQAIDALGRGNPDVAIAELKKLLEINDRSYELHLFLGDAYAGKHQWDRALGEYAAARVLNSHSSAPHVSEARVHLAMHNLTAANAAIDAAAKLEPTGGEVALVRGLILDAESRPEEAIAQYEAAIRINGSDTQARASLAGTAMDLRRYDLAKTQFEALLAMGYRPSRMHFGLAQVAEASGDAKTAAAEYRLTLRLEPAFAPAKSALSRLGQ